ncbi:SDR family oxidoreductase [Deinococcus gobiensis]|uniref:Putative oxidoreductase ytfG n=1 Tax=Deinococcus gobiensis (strain DSM 21396 / JCM 16679 / CGMCC 1.7299 / I-0) TaxID=745776 RepID=H8GWB1_DEIGI|nr:SDR family oxidoreductase [Deinococcus gobiensis]AFD25661.1 putative oxidoreductase ytfG [Deinococcus gobiensis I-0]
MTKIAVTAATGHLGQLTVQALLDRGVPAGDLVAIVRDPQKAQAIAAQGVEVRQADYTQPEGWAQALAGVDRLLLISSSSMEDRAGQHRTVIEAAKAAGVELLAYTSLLKADTAQMSLAADHQATEAILKESGVPYVLLRNGWYLENYNAAQSLGAGAVLGAAGEGRINAASRRDYAEAAAAVLSTEGHAGRTYELGGDQGFTLAELAAEIGRQGGKDVAYHDLPEGEYEKTLEGFGLPTPVAQMLASSDSGVKRGELATGSSDLRDLIGRPTTTLAQGVAAQLGN